MAEGVKKGLGGFQEGQTDAIRYLAIAGAHQLYPGRDANVEASPATGAAHPRRRRIKSAVQLSLLLH
jgi:hypothetical protein